MTKKLLTTSLLGLSLATAAGAAQAEEITLNAVSFTPKSAVVSHGFEAFVEAINEKFDGELQINWRGGPEVMPPFRLADAVRNGSIDMAMTSPSYYSGLVPSATASNLSFKTYDEIAQTGYLDLMTEVHAERGLHYLGEIPASPVKFFLFFKDEVTGLDDISGKRIRVFPTILPFVESLGAEPLVLPMGEIYTAMERGVIDGFAQSNLGWVDQFEDVVNYYVTPPYYRAGFNVLVNPEAWSELPEDLQARVQSYLRDELAPEIDESWNDIIATGYQQMDDAGFQEVELTGDDADQYLSTAIEAAWDKLAEDVDPELHAKLKAMLVD
ncbi:TRAP transporter substrate-binding protein DctP [Halomonas organivorans]|uniref:TRAP-type C4-dicarboxylate transport system substrate-binding protein n=1 Tax=Halomonas organivorans TaxID=257772 RepID=A0A7W5BYH6_9GAMM|nr:TRAP transporter substrate-binding protein DctP [Halomonas organivorans]MBB3141391.1 TRAP-type C4-dicarboxylate transport system substrate-binding protein [Halomonas organivorans]